MSADPWGGHNTDEVAQQAQNDADDAVEAELAFNRDVNTETRRMRVREAARKIIAEEQAGTTTFDDQYLDADQLANLPTPEPLITGILDRHRIAILRGRDRTYKSFIALDWALCLATGKPWQGRVVEQIRVLYIAGEGAYGIAARKNAWEYGWRTKVEPAWFTLRKSAVNLYRGGPALEDLICRTQEGEYGLVIIDTLRRSSGGAEGNGTDMGVVVDNADRVKRATQSGSILTLAHTDKGDNDSRGFSGIEDDADIVWHAKKDLDRGLLAVNLENAKMKDAPESLTLHLMMAPALNSLVVSRVADRPALDELYDSDQVILATMIETFALTGATVPQLVEVTDLPRSTVYKSRGRLLNSGQLISTRRGSSDLLTLGRQPDLFDAESEESLSTIPHPSEHDSTPDRGIEAGFHTDSTVEDSTSPHLIEHDSTPVHTDSTPDSTQIPHPPPLLERGGGVDTVESTPDWEPTTLGKRRPKETK